MAKDMLKYAIFYKKGHIVPTWVLRDEKRKHQHAWTFQTDVLVSRVNGHIVICPASVMGEDEYMLHRRHTGKSVICLSNPYTKEIGLALVNDRERAEDFIKEILYGPQTTDSD